MDIETEKVIELVFPDGIPESWKENPDFYRYLTKLGGFDVDQLSKEPDHLTDEKNCVLENTQELAFANYKTFIQTAESSREICHQFNETENHLDKLLDKIPNFIDKCQFFCDTSKDINVHRHLNSLTLSKNAELLEILEMPQLMEWCLRSSQYNEALELSQYARQLAIKHSDIPVILRKEKEALYNLDLALYHYSFDLINLKEENEDCLLKYNDYLQSIVAEIENSWSGMVGQVVGSLRGDLPLPKCLQLVGLLRSMEAFTESELRIKFLQARDSWLQALLSAIPKDDANIHLTKTIELSRIHLFNIITQYRAMFNDDDHQLAISSRDPIINDSAIFYHWLEEKISQFMRTLEQDLPKVTSIDSVLGQCTYFGVSFGRVGADFTTRMSDIFVEVIGSKFHQNVAKATRKFDKDMETFTLINKLHRMDVKMDPQVKSENPPEQLVDFYPLAEYCNGLISAFNELRLCAPVALAESCTRLLEDSLHNVAKGILIFYKQEQQAFTAAEQENMVKFSECFSDQLIPYVQHCVHEIFPPHQIALYLGISTGQLQKEGILNLERKKIVEPLIALLPIKSVVVMAAGPTINISEEHTDDDATATDEVNSEACDIEDEKDNREEKLPNLESAQVEALTTVASPPSGTDTQVTAERYFSQ